MVKKGLSLLIFVCLTIGFIPTAAFAESPTDAAAPDAGSKELVFDSGSDEDGSEPKTGDNAFEEETILPLGFDLGNGDVGETRLPEVGAGDVTVVETIEELKNAIAVGGEIKLANDIALIETLTIAAGIDITLDLNGFTLSDSVRVFNISGNLKVKDTGTTGKIKSTIVGPTVTTSGIKIASGGNLTMEGGTFDCTITNPKYTTPAIEAASGCTLVMTEGSSINFKPSSSSGIAFDAIVLSGSSSAATTATLKSCNITIDATTTGKVSAVSLGASTGLTMNSVTTSVKNNSGSCYGVSAPSTALSIDLSNCTIAAESTSGSVYCASVSAAEITNCTFTATTTSTYKNAIYGSDNTENVVVNGGSYKGTVTKCTILGGVFDTDVSSSVPQGYKVLSDTPTSGLYTVEKDEDAEDCVTLISGGIYTNYISLSDAATKALAGDTLQLLKDIDLKTFSVTIPAGVTVDLNKKNLTSTNVNGALIVSGGTLEQPSILTDNAAATQNEAGTISGYVSVNAGNTTIEKINIANNAVSKSGRIAVKATGTSSENKAYLNISGANISCSTAVSSSTSEGAITLTYAEVTAGDLSESFPTALYMTSSYASKATQGLFVIAGNGCSVNVTSGSYGLVFEGDAAHDGSIIYSANWPIRTSIDGGAFSIKKEGGAATISSYIIRSTSTSLTTNSASVSGGYFTLEGNARPAYRSTGNIGAFADKMVSGGYFSQNVTTNLADGYSAVSNTDDSTKGAYPWVIEEVGAASTGTGDSYKEYGSIQKALDAVAQDPDLSPITLLRSVVVSGALKIGANDIDVIKDGYSLELSGAPAVILAQGVSMPEWIEDEFEASITKGDDTVQYYKTFASALRSVPKGGTVKLEKDIVVAEKRTVVESLTIDLNGKNYEYAGSSTDVAFQVMSGIGNTCSLTLTDSSPDKGGTLNASGTYMAIAVGSTSGSLGEQALIVDQGVTIKGCVGVFGKSQLDLLGTIEIDGPGFAIGGNGTAGNEGTVINILDGAYVSAPSGAGIYQPQNGKLNISGGTITGATAVYIKAGELTVTGGNLVGTGEYKPYKYNGNGCDSTGEALVIDSCDYPGGPPKITIENGSFISENAPSSVGSYKKSDDPDYADGPDKAVNHFIIGGYFSANPNSDYLDPSVKTIVWLEDREDTPGDPYTVGSVADKILEQAKKGDHIILIKSDPELSLPEGVTVVNETGGDLIINGKLVESGGEIITDHDMLKTEARAATCTEDGNTEYYYCSICENYFADEAGAKEIEKDSWVIPAKGHGELKVVGARAATITEEGYTGDKVCSVCGAIIEPGSPIPKLEDPKKDEKSIPNTGDTVLLPGIFALVLVFGATAAGIGYRRRKSGR